jgi:hypothetical protein
MRASRGWGWIGESVITHAWSVNGAEKKGAVLTSNNGEKDHGMPGLPDIWAHFSGSLMPRLYLSEFFKCVEGLGPWTPGSPAGPRCRHPAAQAAQGWLCLPGPLPKAKRHSAAKYMCKVYAHMGERLGLMKVSLLGAALGGVQPLRVHAGNR